MPEERGPESVSKKKRRTSYQEFARSRTDGPGYRIPGRFFLVHTLRTARRGIAASHARRSSAVRLRSRAARPKDYEGLRQLLEGVEDLESGPLEVSVVSRGDRQPMPAGRRGDVAVFDGHPLTGLLQEALLLGPHVGD